MKKNTFVKNNKLYLGGKKQIGVRSEPRSSTYR